MWSKSGFWIAPNWPYLEKEQCATICWHDFILNFFWRCFVSRVKFSYWSKFHVNIITGYGVITIFFYKRLTRNPEIGNTPIWVLPNIWGLGQVRDTKFVTNVSNKMILNAAKCQGYSFYRFCVINGKSTGRRRGGGKITPTEIRVKFYHKMFLAHKFTISYFFNPS